MLSYIIPDLKILMPIREGLANSLKVYYMRDKLFILAI